MYKFQSIESGYVDGYKALLRIAACFFLVYGIKYL